jgi:high-affinity iron transporter
MMFLQSTGDLGIVLDNVYDLTSVHWLTQDSEVGRFLAAMFGWDPRPSIEQVLVWVGYVAIVGWLFQRGGKAPATTGTAKAPLRA